MNEKNFEENGYNANTDYDNSNQAESNKTGSGIGWIIVGGALAVGVIYTVGSGITKGVKFITGVVKERKAKKEGVVDVESYEEPEAKFEK